MKTVICLLLLISLSFATVAPAAETVFSSGAAVQEELARVADEGKLFVEGPVRPYFAASAAVAGLFTVTYLYDQDIRSDLAGVHSGPLTTFTDFGSAVVGNPFVHLGVAATLYGAGALADSPRVVRLGQEMGEALFLADGASLVLKQAIGRGRPNTGSGNSRYRPLQFKTDYDSLPSMHTASSFALAHVLSSNTESLAGKVLCYTAASFVAFSRLYQNKHWASDVILGAAIGELAGNSVTRYYALQSGKLALAPTAVGGAPALALTGQF